MFIIHHLGLEDDIKDMVMIWLLNPQNYSQHSKKEDFDFRISKIIQNIKNNFVLFYAIRIIL